MIQPLGKIDKPAVERFEFLQPRRERSGGTPRLCFELRLNCACPRSLKSMPASDSLKLFSDVVSSFRSRLNRSIRTGKSIEPARGDDRFTGKTEQAIHSPRLRPARHEHHSPLAAVTPRSAAGGAWRFG